MLKKTLTIILVSVLFVGVMAMPASAAKWYIFDYNDYVVSVSKVDGYDIVTCKVPNEFLSIVVRDQYSAELLGRSEVTSGKPTVSVYMDGTDNIALGGRRYSVSFSVNRLWLGNIPNGTECSVTVDVSTNSSYHTPDGRFQASYLLGDGVYQWDSWGDARKATVDDKNTFVGQLNTSDTYCASVFARFNNFIRLTDGVASFTLHSFEFTLKIPSAYRAEWINGNAETISARNELLLKNQQNLLESIQAEQELTNDMLEDMPEEFGNEMQGVIDSEKQEVSNAGDSAAGELMDIIPNESQGFMDAIQSLVSSMSYSGTDAKLPVPAITIPAIPGVMDAIQLTDELSVDFGYWVQQLPGGVLKLVQILCTIALIVYCFKELYGMIAYAMTLKGGGSSE